MLLNFCIHFILIGMFLSLWLLYNFVGSNVTGTPRRIPILKKGASDENFLDTDDEFWDPNSVVPSPGPVLKVEFKVIFIVFSMNFVNRVIVFSVYYIKQKREFWIVLLILKIISCIYEKT